MHEISIMQALFQQVEGLAGQYGSHRIRHIVVEVGEISNLVPELLQQAFEAFQLVEPLLEEAQLEIRKTPGEELLLRDVELEVQEGVHCG